MIRYIIFAIVIATTSGCGLVVRLEDGIVTSDGHDKYHSVACGPMAISNLLYQFDDHYTPKEISDNILEHQDGSELIGREFLAIFDVKARQITWRDEIIKTLNRYGYEVTEIRRGIPSNLDDILSLSVIQGKRGIALMNHRGTTVFHYEAFPPISRVYRNYGDETALVELYIVSQISRQELANHQ